MGNEAKLQTFMLASDYFSAHYKWTETELSALGECRATAEVIKKRLEDNSARIAEMYAIEHKGEKRVDSKSKEFHGAADETKLHYHILVKFKDEQGIKLKEIAKYIGVRPEYIIKLNPGGYSYNNCLAYLIHIKYKDKKQYVPKAVATLAGTDYVSCYNRDREIWLKGRDVLTVKGGKTLNRLFREAVTKMESGELLYSELAGTEYRRLLFEPKYMKQLKQRGQCVREVAEQDCNLLEEKIKNREITSLDEIIESEDWKLAYKYKKNDILEALQKQKEDLIEQNCHTLCGKIENEEKTPLPEIMENEYWNLFSESQQKQIIEKLSEQAQYALQKKLDTEGITSMDEILSDEYWKLGFKKIKNHVEVWCVNHGVPYKREYNSL